LSLADKSGFQRYAPNLPFFPPHDPLTVVRPGHDGAKPNQIKRHPVRRGLSAIRFLL
jgi:hypothetical protein